MANFKSFEHPQNENVTGKDSNDGKSITLYNIAVCLYRGEWSFIQQQPNYGVFIVRVDL